MSESATIVEQRIRAAMPTRELERRWSAVRKAMTAAGIDALVLQNDNQYLGGYVRYFLDIPTEQAYPVTVIFPANDGMTVISHGGSPKPPGPPDWAIRGVSHRVARPYFRTIYFTNNFDAEEAVRIIQARKDKKIGLVGLGAMHAAFYAYLKDNLPGVEIVEATDLVDQIKAVKSEDELVFVRTAIQTQDAVFAEMDTILRPGKYEYQVRAEIVRMLIELGSEEQLVRLSSAPPGKPAGTMDTFYQNRQIQHGDQVCILIEPNGSGGFYGEIARTWCLGAAPEALLELWKIAVRAQEFAANLLKPGARPAEVFETLNEFLVSNGQPAEGRLNAHGQGYDLVERPAFMPGEHMLLQANMVVALHPVTATASASAICCDDFLVTPQGGQRLHQTPQQVFVINC